MTRYLDIWKGMAVVLTSKREYWKCRFDKVWLMNYEVRNQVNPQALEECQMSGYFYPKCRSVMLVHLVLFVEVGLAKVNLYIL